MKARGTHRSVHSEVPLHALLGGRSGADVVLTIRQRSVAARPKVGNEAYIGDEGHSSMTYNLKEPGVAPQALISSGSLPRKHSL